MAQKQAPAPFLVKTYQMVEEVDTDEVISWNEEGSGFVVWKPAEFSRDLLPVFFNHCNFSSFVRQLNTYGFRKVVPERWEFANNHFRRGERSLLSEIRRRKRSSSQEGDQSSTSTSTSSPPPDQRHKLTALSDENEKLRKENERLNSEVENSKRRHERLLVYLSRYVDPEGLAMAAAAASGEKAENGEDEESGGLRLFGVSLRKRRRCNGEERRWSFSKLQSVGDELRNAIRDGGSSLPD